jgi:hypothetical protein
MSEYADRFVENRIDLSVLQVLTDQHAKDLGVRSFIRTVDPSECMSYFRHAGYEPL